MGRSQATFSKKENEKKRLKKRNEKLEKKEERQANAKKGASLEDMMAYVDENGNITTTPPDPTKRKAIKAGDIQIAVAKQEDIIDENPVKKGTVTFFNQSKGYGFIRNTETRESIFVHANDLVTQIAEGDNVNFEIGKGQKGPTALNVTKI